MLILNAGLHAIIYSNPYIFGICTHRVALRNFADWKLLGVVKVEKIIESVQVNAFNFKVLIVKDGLMPNNIDSQIAL